MTVVRNSVVLIPNARQMQMRTPGGSRETPPAPGGLLNCYERAA